MLLALLFASTGYAQEQEPEEAREGYFEIRTADSQLVDGVHMLDARMQLVLSSEALEALSSGFTLTIELQVELIRVRRWYVDDLEAELATRYELEYSPLSQRYIVRNLNSGEQDSFATLYSALNNLGRVQRLPLIDDTLLESDSEYRVRTRALLQTRQYSAPIRMLFFWRGQWQLESEWIEWILER
ncbi:MAG: DUF4390 domain-containing protein [Woeseiaceae bacterium]